MRPLSLPKSSLLTKPWEYRTVYRHGLRLRGRDFLTLHLLPNAHGVHRLGISVHGVKSAVRRNRIKRIIREFFRLQRDPTEWGLPPELSEIPLDVVFAIRKEFTADSPREVAQLVSRLISSNKGKLQSAMKQLRTPSANAPSEREGKPAWPEGGARPFASTEPPGARKQA